ncbi:coupling factor for flagellin transcription and translation [Bacillus sp. Marseille-P3661]|uniref:coupling factor for flagellin transcription and translation n=1 Tax=Bacillus sp. Marseille-P3661 TaxID=1936234 RepID=UPI000C835192|nr:coupling factor for flagellin transcription and translation [Bacillus sp. Marseille-P3661]
MLPFMLTISFILHILAFFWIMLLTLKLNRNNEIESTNIQKEIEDILQTYLTEMKDENEKLLNQIEKSGNTNNVVHTDVISGSKRQVDTIKRNTISTYKRLPTEVSDKPVKQLYRNTTPPKEEPMTLEQPKKEYVPPQPSSDDQFVPSLTSQVLLLNEQGFTPNQIAQKLNKGQTEIELLLKFRQESKENT